MSLNSSITDLVNRAYNLVESYVKPQGAKILSLIGLLYLVHGSLSALRSFRRTFLPFSFNLAKRYGPGSWALITGGAQGIGAAYAAELASRGFNLVLIDLDEQRLTETTVLLNAKYPQVQIKTIVCNFSKSLQEGFFDSIMEQINGLDISILVNNVGTGVPPGPIYSVPEAAMLNTITVNTVPMTVLTRRLIPQMLKRPERSAIINMSSITGVYPTPWIATYSATKAYVDFFTRAIEKDVSHKIDVLSVRPSAVSTAMIRNPKLGGGVITGDHVAKSVLSKIGRVTYTHGHWQHEVAGWTNRNPLMSRYFTSYFFNTILGIKYKS